jgi:hypothetical protein
VYLKVLEKAAPLHDIFVDETTGHWYNAGKAKYIAYADLLNDQKNLGHN